MEPWNLTNEYQLPKLTRTTDCTTAATFITQSTITNASMIHTQVNHSQPSAPYGEWTFGLPTFPIHTMGGTAMSVRVLPTDAVRDVVVPGLAVYQSFQSLMLSRTKPVA